MGSLVTYQFEGSVALITMDDGKVNVLSPAMQAELHQALDRAVADSATVLLSGREGIFSAGFDLKVLRAGGDEAGAMLNGGFELAERLLTFPTPVVIACTGHAIAMGLFLLQAGDYRLGTSGDFKLVANEVQIGMLMPRAAIEMVRQRLSPGYAVRVLTLAETFAPEDALAAGLVDKVVPATQIGEASRRAAEGFAAINMSAHLGTKLRVRQDSLEALRAAMKADAEEYKAFASS